MNKKDEIFLKKKKESITAISFLESLNANLDKDTAFKIALDAFSRYMIKVYDEILGDTEKGSQERFDCLRKAYENSAKIIPYLKIIESTPKVLKARFERCPFYEVLIEAGLEEFGLAFCLSDPAFTKELLPGVKFSRKHVIAEGGPFCDNTWEFNA